jgi:hypothetical protein
VEYRSGLHPPSDAEKGGRGEAETARTRVAHMSTCYYYLCCTLKAKPRRP